MKHHVTCAICGKQDYIVVGNGAENKVGWFFFGKININSIQTSKFFFRFDQNLELTQKIRNEYYNSKAKKKLVEYWECPKCFNAATTKPVE